MQDEMSFNLTTLLMYAYVGMATKGMYCHCCRKPQGSSCPMCESLTMAEDVLKKQGELLPDPMWFPPTSWRERVHRWAHHGTTVVKLKGV